MAIPVGGLKDSDDLKAWLDSLPEAQRSHVARVISYRAELRILPLNFKIKIGDINTEYRPNVEILSYIITLLIMKRIVEKQINGNDNIKINEYISKTTNIYSNKNLILTFEEIDKFRYQSIWEFISEDAFKYEIGGTNESIVKSALWPNGSIGWWRWALKDFEAISAESISYDHRNVGWRIWLNWYVPIVSGRPPWGLDYLSAVELEDRIALGDGRDDFWERNPAAINSEIAEWVGEARAAHTAPERPAPTISQAVLDFLRSTGRPHRSAEILSAVRASGLAVQEKSVWDNLSRLNRAGEIERVRPAVYQIADKSGNLLSQAPAPYSFSVSAKGIEAKPQTGLPIDAATSSEILAELLEKAAAHRQQLAGCGNAISEHVLNNADKLEKTLADWRKTPAPGVLLMHLRTLEAITSAYDTPDGKAVLYSDAHLAMMDLQGSVSDFISLHPVVQKMQAAALALRIQRQDVVSINAELLKIEVAASRSSIVVASSMAALQVGKDEINETTRIIETSSDASKVAKAVEQRAEVTAHRVMSFGNFARAIIGGAQKGAISGTEKGVEGVVSGGIKVGAAALLGVVAGPVVALGQWVASLVPLGKKATEVLEADQDAPPPPP